MPYIVLKEGERYIKPIDELFDDADDGMTQRDLDAAETYAMHITNGKIGWGYDISTWQDDPPPLVEYINDLLASAKALEFYLNRDTNITLGAEFQPDKMEKDALEMLDGIRLGGMELTDTDGSILSRKQISPRQGIRHRESAATFYPDKNSHRSFGVPARFTAERTYKKT